MPEVSVTELAQDIARLEEKAEAQEKTITRLEAKIDKLVEAIGAMQSDIDKASGGFHALIAAAGMAAALGSALTWVVEHIVLK